MNLLNEDNFLHIFLNRVGDIVVANLLFILCSIPVITAGPSLTALYHCMLRCVKGTEDGTVKTFFAAFKENFRQSLAAWLAFLAAAALLIANVRFLSALSGPLPRVLLWLCAGCGVLILVLALYLFPVIAAFSNRLPILARNAFLLALTHFPSTVLIAVLTLLPMYMTYRDLALMPLYACCWFFFGFGLTAYVNSFLFYRIFKKFL